MSQIVSKRSQEISGLDWLYRRYCISAILLGIYFITDILLAVFLFFLDSWKTSGQVRSIDSIDFLGCVLWFGLIKKFTLTNIYVSCLTLDYIIDSVLSSKTHKGFNLQHKLDFIRTIKRKANKGKYLCTSFVDFQKVYDSISRDGMKDKLEKIVLWEIFQYNPRNAWGTKCFIIIQKQSYSDILHD